MRISVVIPAHNEANSIGDIVRHCKQHCDEIIVVDDGSTDETSVVARAAGATVIQNKVNLGVVKSTEIGLKFASGDIVVTLDADGQHDPSQIPSVVQPIIHGLADLVLGRRDTGRPLSERAIARVVNLRLKCNDVGTGYRAFRRELAHVIRFRGFCLCGSLVLEAARLGARVAEVPIATRPRRFGRSHWHTSVSRARIHFKQTIFVLWVLLESLSDRCCPRRPGSLSVPLEKAYLLKARVN